MCVYATCTSGAIHHDRIHHGRIRATRHHIRIGTDSTELLAGGSTEPDYKRRVPEPDHKRRVPELGLLAARLGPVPEPVPVGPERHSRTLAEVDTVARIDLLPVETEPTSRQ